MVIKKRVQKKTVGANEQSKNARSYNVFINTIILHFLYSFNVNRAVNVIVVRRKDNQNDR